MNLPPLLQKRILFILYHLPQLGSGQLQVDPRWQTCIQQVVADLSSEEKRRFFQLYFRQGACPDDIKNELFIESSTFYCWRREILWQVALRAAALGLVVIR